MFKIFLLQSNNMTKTNRNINKKLKIDKKQRHKQNKTNLLITEYPSTRRRIV